MSTPCSISSPAPAPEASHWSSYWWSSPSSVNYTDTTPNWITRATLDQTVAMGPNADTAAARANIRWRNRGNTAAKFVFAGGSAQVLATSEVRRLNFYPAALPQSR
ncbi:MAG: hypothetical protein ACFCU3_04170 [Verrucomicrobiales bacterium]